MITMRDLAWVAGVIEGEGCISIYRPKKSPSPVIKVAVGMTDEDVVRRIAGTFKTGHVNGPYHDGRATRKPHWKPFWQWVVASNQVASVLMTIFPFLGKRRKQKAIESLTIWRKIPNRCELRLACKWGHEYTPENTFYWPSDSGRKCRACESIKASRLKEKRRMAKVAAACLLVTAIWVSGCVIPPPATPEQQFQNAYQAQQLQQLSNTLQNIGMYAGNLAGRPIPYGYASGNRPTEIWCNNLGAFTTCSSN